MKNMKRILMVVLSTCVLAGLSANAIVVPNSTFETTSASTGSGAANWTGVNTSGGNTLGDVSGLGVGSSFGEEFFQGGTGQPTINNMPGVNGGGISLTSATMYQVSFWAMDLTSSGASGHFTVELDAAGDQIQAVASGATIGSYTQYILNFTVSVADENESKNLMFSWQGTGDGLLDNVTVSAVSAVPEPGTLIAGLLVLLPSGVSTLQILRKRRNT
jgi:hypothetical protein